MKSGADRPSLERGGSVIILCVLTAWLVWCCPFANAETLYAGDPSGDLLTVNPTNGQQSFIGHGNFSLTGLAFSPSGVLYGGDPSGDLLSINPTNGQQAFIGHGNFSITALAFSSSGILYGGDPSGDLLTVNPTNGQQAFIGHGNFAIGDLAFVPVPEPSAFSMFILAAMCMSGFARRRYWSQTPGLHQGRASRSP
jgi:predicted small integral membrane protein